MKEYRIVEHLLEKNDARYTVRTPYLAFENQGNTVIWINRRRLLPGDYYTISLQLPGVIVEDFSIRFENNVLPGTAASERVDDKKQLLIQYLKEI